jgi:trehalose synthase-fused probable maltokinase
MLTLAEAWEQVLEGDQKSALEAALADVLMTRRWFGGKARHIRTVQIIESIPIPEPVASATLLFIRVDYTEGSPEIYSLPLAAAFGEQADRIREELPHTVVAPVKLKNSERSGLLYDALWTAQLAEALLETIAGQRRYAGLQGTLVGSSTKAFAALLPPQSRLDPTVLKAEQSNTSVAYGDRAIFKLYRRLGNGMNPDLEIGRVLTEMNFPYIPPVGGAIEYCRTGEEPVTVGLLQAFVPNHGDAWQHTLEAVSYYFRQIQSHSEQLEGTAIPKASLPEPAEQEPPTVVHSLVGPYLESAKRLGQRTAELHVALAQCRDNERFRAEPCSREYRQSRYASMCRLMDQACALLERQLTDFPLPRKEEARRLLNERARVMARFHGYVEQETTALRIRCHGDYHLGQVLWTGQNFIIVDFEGEPARPLAERRIKHPAVLDVAGMLRSFHYAPHVALANQWPDAATGGRLETFGPWIRGWYGWVSAEFLRGYLGIAGRASFSPQSSREFRALLEIHLLEKACYELNYELNNRPAWAWIPLRGICELVLQLPGEVS